MCGFLDGWIATDASPKNNGAVRLSSSHSDAKAWLEENAAIGGWIFAGFSIDSTTSTNYGERSEPLTVFTLARSRRAWCVVSIELLDIGTEVYCAEVPGINEFVLASGVVTGNCGLHEAYGISGEPAGNKPPSRAMDRSLCSA